MRDFGWAKGGDLAAPEAAYELTSEQHSQDTLNEVGLSFGSTET